MRRRAVRILALLLMICSQAGADQALQAPVYRINKAVQGAGSKAIRGLLKRQHYCDPGYGYCQRTGICCPAGGQCCNDGHCCGSGQWCTAPGHCCYDSEDSCQGIGCCTKSESCCGDGGCCPSGSYCVLGTNDKVGCCPDGTTCYGPVGGGGGGGNNGGGNSGGGNSGGGNSGGGNGGGNSGGNNGGGSNGGAPTTHTPSPTSSYVTHAPSFTPPTTSLTTPISSQASPSASPGFLNVVVTQDSPQITWSTGGWGVEVSTCDSAQRSKLTTTRDQWFTFITSANASPYIYISIAVQGASFSVYINGAEANVNLGELTNNCTYHQLDSLRTGSTNNITIYVYGPLMSGRQLGSAGLDWSFAFNNFIIGQQLNVAANSASSPTQAGAASKIVSGMVVISSLISLLLVPVWI